MKGKRYTVVLANLGAPANLDEVRPFLKNIFNDPDIFNFPFGKIGREIFASLMATLRAPKSRKYYAAIGGGSPLHKNTVEQADKLKQSLAREGDFDVKVAQRYWCPYLSDVAADLRLEGIENIILLPLYPHYSTTTTLSIKNEWQRVASDLTNTKVIERFYNNKYYIKACTKQIKEKLKKFDTDPHILFSAHSIPVKRVMDGDPYEKEINHNVELIMQNLGKDYSYSLSYQSKVGPVKWLSPSVEEEVDRLVAEGICHLLVFPISFVSEHLETLYELDIRKKDYALKSGIEIYERANTVQTQPEFIKCLNNLVLEAI